METVLNIKSTELVSQFGWIWLLYIQLNRSKLISFISCEMKLLNHFQTPTIQLLTFVKGQCHSTHHHWCRWFSTLGLHLIHISKRITKHYIRQSYKCLQTNMHGDVIKWVTGPLCRNSPFTSEFPAGQWRRALMFSLICVWIYHWVNNRETGDLRCNRTHYDVTVMTNRNPIICIMPGLTQLLVMLPVFTPPLSFHWHLIFPTAVL